MFSRFLTFFSFFHVNLLYSLDTDEKLIQFFFSASSIWFLWSLAPSLAESQREVLGLVCAVGTPLMSPALQLKLEAEVQLEHATESG